MRKRWLQHSSTSKPGLGTRSKSHDAARLELAIAGLGMRDKDKVAGEIKVESSAGLGNRIKVSPGGQKKSGGTTTAERRLSLPPVMSDRWVVLLSPRVRRVRTTV